MTQLQKLQEVQNQITEMIKSDYPKPIFNYSGGNRLEFQFDNPSFHGESEIGIYNNINPDDEEVILFEGYGSTIDNNCTTVEEFMNEFKKVYALEQEMLVEYVNGRI
jgi:hypothetical protein